VLERPWSGSSEGPKPPLGCQVLVRYSSGRDNLENRASVRLCGTCWEPLKTAGQPCEEKHVLPTASVLLFVNYFIRVLFPRTVACMSYRCGLSDAQLLDGRFAQERTASSF
jgi:hypothetical protein